MPLARYKNLAAERKEAILRAAAHEFAEKGYERASLNRMIKEAGLSKGTFYYYFEDKTDLFVTVLRGKLPWEVWLSESRLLDSDDETSFWRCLRALDLCKYAYLGQYADIARLVDTAHGLSASHFDNASLADYVAEREAETRRVIEHGRKVGAVRGDLPLQLLLNLWAGIARSLSEWIFKDWDVLSQVERTQRGDIAFETVQRVIGIAGQEVTA